MDLHFEVTKEGKKAMIRAIEQELGLKAQYLGVPSCAFKVGDYQVERDGTLSWTDLDDAGPQYLEQNAKVVDACVMATGVSPAEWDFFEDQTRAFEEHENGAETIGTEPSIPAEQEE